MKKYGEVTGIIWLNDISARIHIEKGIPYALYNSLYDCINRIPISSSDLWEEKWKVAIESLHTQLNDICVELI